MDFLKNIVKFCQMVGEAAPSEAGGSAGQEPGKPAAASREQKPKTVCPITERDIDELSLMIDHRSQYYLSRMLYHKKKAMAYVKAGYGLMAQNDIDQYNYFYRECNKFQKHANAVVRILNNAINSQMVISMMEAQAEKFEAFANQDVDGLISKLGKCQDRVHEVESLFDRLNSGFLDSSIQEGGLTLAQLQEECRMEQPKEGLEDDEEIAQLNNQMKY